LYSDKEGEVKAKAANMKSETVAAALPSWALPICLVGAVAAVASLVGIRRRRAARSTRTIQGQTPQPIDSASDEEPFLFSDFAEV